MSRNNTTQLRRKDDQIMKEVQSQQSEILSLLRSHDEKLSRNDEKLSKLLVGMYGIPDNRQRGIIDIVQDHETRIDQQEQKTHDFPFKFYGNVFTSGKTILAVLTALQISLMTVVAFIINYFVNQPPK